MKNSISASIIIFVTLISPLILAKVVSGDPKEVESWFETIKYKKQPVKMTKLHFYFHDVLHGKNVTSAVVAQSNISNASPTYFGILVSADDPLTVGPDMKSKRVGYLKGFYGTTSFEELDVMMAMTFVFTDGISNGSSISVLGHNPELNLYREVPIVGGSGRFRLARGVATLKNYYYNLDVGNATVEVDIVILHY